jgi:hypothetical protein
MYGLGTVHMCSIEMAQDTHPGIRYGNISVYRLAQLIEKLH